MLANPHMVAVYDFVQRHRETKDHLVQSVRLDNSKADGLLLKYIVWRLEGAVIYRVKEIKEDLDGSLRAYHEPTDEHFDGEGPGLGKQSLFNAVQKPSVRGHHPYKDESSYLLTSGCQLLRDFYKAKSLQGKPDNSARDALDAILKAHKVSTYADLEKQSKTAICVKYIDGRPKADSRNDWWKHVKSWCGVQVDNKTKLPKKRPNGFYFPLITPPWADADKHPWVVLNPQLKTLGVRLGNYSAILVNGESPKAAFGIVADVGNEDELGECSGAMIGALGIPNSLPPGDYIFILFPGDQDMNEKSPEDIRKGAKAKFDSWSLGGRHGMEVVKELFPTHDEYSRMKMEYLKWYNSLPIRNVPGDFPPQPQSRAG